MTALAAALARVQALEELLARARQWMGCMSDPDSATYRDYREARALVDAALAPPAAVEPAKDEHPLCDACGEYVRDCWCDANERVAAPTPDPVREAADRLAEAVRVWSTGLPSSRAWTAREVALLDALAAYDRVRGGGAT